MAKDHGGKGNRMKLVEDADARFSCWIQGNKGVRVITIVLTTENSHRVRIDHWDGSFSVEEIWYTFLN